MSNFNFDYKWKPSDNIIKPDIKVGTLVIYKGKIETVSRVDRHVYPICLKGIGRVALEDIDLTFS